MRQLLFVIVLTVFIAGLIATTARAGRPSNEGVRSVRAEVAAVIPPADVRPAAGTAGRGVTDIRDSAALVLVGTMLIGLAAAVRRTV